VQTTSQDTGRSICPVNTDDRGRRSCSSSLGTRNDPVASEPPYRISRRREQRVPQLPLWSKRGSCRVRFDVDVPGFRYLKVLGEIQRQSDPPRNDLVGVDAPLRTPMPKIQEERREERLGEPSRAEPAMQEVGSEEIDRKAVAPLCGLGHLVAASPAATHSAGLRLV
jgi:hypothetical protein